MDVRTRPVEKVTGLSSVLDLHTGRDAEGADTNLSEDGRRLPKVGEKSVDAHNDKNTVLLSFDRKGDPVKAQP